MLALQLVLYRLPVLTWNRGLGVEESIVNAATDDPETVHVDALEHVLPLLVVSLAQQGEKRKVLLDVALADGLVLVVGVTAGGLGRGGGLMRGAGGRGLDVVVVVVVVVKHGERET